MPVLRQGTRVARLGVPVKYCHECGAKIPDEARFCTQCGTRQMSKTMTPPPPPSPPPVHKLKSVCIATDIVLLISVFFLPWASISILGVSASLTDIMTGFSDMTGALGDLASYIGSSSSAVMTMSNISTLVAVSMVCVAVAIGFDAYRDFTGRKGPGSGGVAGIILFGLFLLIVAGINGEISSAIGNAVRYSFSTSVVSAAPGAWVTLAVSVFSIYIHRKYNVND